MTQNPGYFFRIYTCRISRWFYGNMKRLEAERTLMQSFNKYGSFLIRSSETTVGDYSLSVRVTERVRHYRIKKLETASPSLEKLHLKPLLSLSTITRSMQVGCVLLYNVPVSKPRSLRQEIYPEL